MVEVLTFATQHGVWTFLGVWMLSYTVTGGLLRFFTAVADVIKRK